MNEGNTEKIDSDRSSSMSLNNCRIFVGGLPTSKTKNEIWQQLTSLYKITNIVDVITYRDYLNPAHNRGFVFLEFRTHEEASYFRTKYRDGKLNLFGKQLTVNWAAPISESGIVMDNQVAETQSTVSTDTISTGRVSVTDSDLESALENYTFQIEEYKGKRPLDQTQTDTNLPKKANIDITNIDSVFHEGLEALLKKNTEGNIILLNKNKLTNDQRQKLANIIINELIGVYGPELQQHTILKVAKEIGQIFTHETADAYMISSDDGGPKGKLWNRYHNIKKALHLANTVKKKELQSTAISSPDKLETTNLLDFLKVGTEPFIKVLDAWEQTYKLRRKLYLNSGLKEIYQDFPCLSLNRGIELIETDFNNRFAGKIDIIYTNWPKISQAILNEAKERKIKIFDDGNFADKNVHAIMCLVYLFQPITVKKNRKGGNWRPTRSEIMDSFFLRVEDFDQLKDRVDARKTKLNDEALQPFAAIVGIKIENAEYYICIENMKYKVETCIRTLELLFKVFYALDLSYPLESEHIWVLLEEMVFEMKPKKKHSSAASVMSDLNYHLQMNDEK